MIAVPLILGLQPCQHITRGRCHCLWTPRSAYFDTTLGSGERRALCLAHAKHVQAAFGDSEPGSAEARDSPPRGRAPAAHFEPSADAGHVDPGLGQVRPDGKPEAPPATVQCVSCAPAFRLGHPTSAAVARGGAGAASKRTCPFHPSRRRAVRELEIERQNRILRSRIEHIGGTSRSGPVQSRRRRKGKRAQLRPAPLACDSAASLPAEDGIAASNDGARPVGEDHRAGEGTGAAGSAAGPRIRIVVSSDGEEVGEESYPLEYGEGRAAAAEGARTAPKSSHRGEGPPAGVASPGAKDLSFSDLHLLRMTRRREAEQERRQEENAVRRAAVQAPCERGRPHADCRAAQRLLHRLDRVRPVYSRERWREAMATHEHFRKLRQQQPTPKGMHGHPGSRASGSTRRAHAVQIVVESAENDWVDVHKQDIPQSPARRVSGDLAPEAEPASPRSASEGSSAPEGGGGGAGLPDGILGEVRRDSEGRVYVLGSGGGSVAGTDSRDGDRADLMAAAAALASATGSGGGAALPSAKGRSRRKRPGLRSSRSADARAYEALVRGPSRTPHPARLVAKGPSARQEARRLEEQRRWLERHRSGTQGGRRGERTEAVSRI